MTGAKRSGETSIAIKSLSAQGMTPDDIARRLGIGRHYVKLVSGVLSKREWDAISALRALVAEGKSVRVAGKQLGFTPSRTQRTYQLMLHRLGGVSAIRKIGASGNNRIGGAELARRVVELHFQGKTTKEIVEEVGSSPDYVRRIVRLHKKASKTSPEAPQRPVIDNQMVQVPVGVFARLKAFFGLHA